MGDKRGLIRANRRSNDSSLGIGIETNEVELSNLRLPSAKLGDSPLRRQPGKVVFVTLGSLGQLQVVSPGHRELHIGRWYRARIPYFD
jgi:hypothetical protein